MLIITYYWPPAGGPGVQRILKFVKYLSDFNWEPIVLTVENGEYPAIDEGLRSEIPNNVKVYKTTSFELFSLYKKFSGKKENIPTHVLSSASGDSLFQKAAKWIRTNLLLPDARVGWIPSIKKEGLKIIIEEKPDLIFSSSPPHSLQLGAMKLAKKTNLRWVADFRDPWRNAFWQKDIKKTRISGWIDRKNESKVLRTADAITTVSKSLVKDFENIQSNLYFDLTNGYDESDFQGIEKKESNKFRINYTGTLSKDQKINNLLKAIELLPDNIKNIIEVNFYGSVHQSMIELINASDIKRNINFHAGISHEEIVKIMINSEILLLVIPDSGNNLGIVTGKIFEYLAAKNFILGIGPENGDAAFILNETKCGKMYNYEFDLSKVLEEEINRWKNKLSREVNKSAIEKYSRKNITEKLTHIFRDVL